MNRSGRAHSNWLETDGEAGLHPAILQATLDDGSFDTDNH
jgi:hypothetical protein